MPDIIAAVREVGYDSWLVVELDSLNSYVLRPRCGGRTNRRLRGRTQTIGEGV